MTYHDPQIRAAAKLSLEKEGKKTTERNISIRGKKLIEQQGAVIKDGIASVQVDINIHEAFDLLPIYLEMVVKGFCSSLFLTGEGGIGKTFEVERTLEHLQSEAEEEVDVVRISGVSSPGGLYDKLYENRDAIILVDDMDDVFRETRSQAILKAVLDTREVREVHWNSSSTMIRAPKQFVFNGRIVIITNFSLKKANESLQAIITRAYYLDFTFPKEQKMERILSICGTSYKDTTSEHRKMVAEWMQANIDKFPDINLRTYIKILDMSRFKPDDWQKLALSVR